MKHVPVWQIFMERLKIISGYEHLYQQSLQEKKNTSH